MISKTSLFALFAASLSVFSPVKAESDVLDLTAADFEDTMKQNPLVLAGILCSLGIHLIKVMLRIVWALQGFGAGV